jgi:protein-disulfide isomerase
MRRFSKLAIFSLVLLSLALASCKPAAAEAAPTLAPTAVPAGDSASAAVQPTPGPATCVLAANALPAAGSEELAALAAVPAVSDADLVRGSVTAPITILEYSDYQ